MLFCHAFDLQMGFIKITNAVPLCPRFLSIFSGPVNLSDKISQKVHNVYCKISYSMSVLTLTFNTISSRFKVISIRFQCAASKLCSKNALKLSCCAWGDPIKEIPNQWQFPFCQRLSTKTFRVINKNISTSTKTCQNRPPFFCEYKKYTSFFFFYIHYSIQSPFLTVQLLNRCHCLKPLFLCYHLHMASLSTSHSFCLFEHTCTTLAS